MFGSESACALSLLPGMVPIMSGKGWLHSTLWTCSTRHTASHTIHHCLQTLWIPLMWACDRCLWAHSLSFCIQVCFSYFLLSFSSLLWLKPRMPVICLYKTSRGIKYRCHRNWDDIVDGVIIWVLLMHSESILPLCIPIPCLSWRSICIPHLIFTIHKSIPALWLYM